MLYVLSGSKKSSLLCVPHMTWSRRRSSGTYEQWNAKHGAGERWQVINQPYRRRNRWIVRPLLRIRTRPALTCAQRGSWLPSKVCVEGDVSMEPCLNRSDESPGIITTLSLIHTRVHRRQLTVEEVLLCLGSL
jgi:hypothetical protein